MECEGALNLWEQNSGLDCVPKWLCVYRATSLTPVTFKHITGSCLFLPHSHLGPLPWGQQQEMALTFLLPTLCQGLQLTHKSHLPKVWTPLAAWFLNSLSTKPQLHCHTGCMYLFLQWKCHWLQILPQLLHINWKQKYTDWENHSHYILLRSCT